MGNKHPIIAHGEVYAEPVSRHIPSGPKILPREYSEAKQRVLGNLSTLENALTNSEELFLEEKIVCVRLEPKFEAKSYVPASLVNAMSDCSEIIGGRKYTARNGDGEISAKLYFVKTTVNGIREFRSTLESGTRDNVKQWRQELSSIHAIDLLSSEEKVMGFEEDWEFGNVEFVLHPISGNTDTKIQTFLDICEFHEDDVKIKTYDDGITFISAKCGTNTIEKAKRFNPLRAAHPLGNVGITRSQSVAGTSCPKPPQQYIKPTVNIGVFDGGVDEQIPILKKYVSSIEATAAPAIQEGIAHGSGVCSAILYENLAGLSAANTLATPCVSIDCYRVLPQVDRKDLDLYEVIDLIESVVPNKTDTRLYNLSFGPDGAIVDDSISRFTYALDKLSYKVPEGVDNPLFVVAAGNDGNLYPPFNRIQAPSDIVNGLAVGAFTLNAQHATVPAEYSCVGPGREGAKTKPDLLAFGGDDSFPFMIPGLDHRSLSSTAGTSFSAPVITGKIGRLMAMSKGISPHMGRTLLIHNTEVNQSFTKAQQGFGFCPDHVDNILECDDNNITIMYNGIISPTQFITLPIFAPRINEAKGLATISWTVALVVDPNANDPDAYTNNCITDVFSPHSMTFNFTKDGTTKRLNLLNPENIPIAKELMDTGFKKASTPVSRAAKKVWDEEDLRAVELKWDTIIHKSVRLQCKSLFDPTLTLHAMGRNGFEGSKMKYYVAVSVNAPKYKGSLYDAVLQTYSSLTPIQLRNISRVRYY